MKAVLALFAAGCLTGAAWGAVPPSAVVLYDNGPVDGHTMSWEINDGFSVADSFFLENSSTIQGFDFYVWAMHGDTLSTVEWSIKQLQTGFNASGTATPQGTFLFTTVDLQFDIYKETVSNLVLPELPSETYWLSLQNATTAQGLRIFWDQNSGVGCTSSGCPSQAMDSAQGDIPSESFDITGIVSVQNGTPEPTSILLFGSGMTVVAGLLRRSHRKA